MWEENIHVGKKLHCKTLPEPLIKLNICIVFEPTIPFNVFINIFIVFIPWVYDQRRRFTHAPEGKGKNVHDAHELYKLGMILIATKSGMSYE